MKQEDEETEPSHFHDANSHITHHVHDIIGQLAEDSRKNQTISEQIKKIGEKSDRKKYNFVEGLAKDVMTTREMIDKLSEERGYTTFKEIFEESEGMIANLNRVLQNLKKSGEIDYPDEVEIFLQGQNDLIKICPVFSSQHYIPSTENCYQKDLGGEISIDTRRGRNYYDENLATSGVTDCSICKKHIDTVQRLVIRGKVYHRNCIKCTFCERHPSENVDFVSFDGNIFCGARCLFQYDSTHRIQERL